MKPNSAVLVLVLLRLPGKPAVVVNDGRSGDVQVEFAPEPSLVEDVSDSLAGICVTEPCEVIVAVIALEVRMFV